MARRGRPRTSNYYARRSNKNAQRRVSVDTTQINKMFASLGNNAERKASVKSGLRKSGNVLRQSVFRAMKSSHPKLGATEYKRGIKTTVYKNATGVRVDIFGKASKADYKFFAKRDAADKMFILKFFADGTKERSTKGRGRYSRRKNTGRIMASNFFERGVASGKFKAASTLKQNIEVFIKRKANKKYGANL